MYFDNVIHFYRNDESKANLNIYNLNRLKKNLTPLEIWMLIFHIKENEIKKDLLYNKTKKENWIWYMFPPSIANGLDYYQLKISETDLQPIFDITYKRNKLNLLVLKWIDYMQLLFLNPNFIKSSFYFKYDIKIIEKFFEKLKKAYDEWNKDENKEKNNPIINKLKNIIDNKSTYYVKELQGKNTEQEKLEYKLIGEYGPKKYINIQMFYDEKNINLNDVELDEPFNPHQFDAIANALDFTSEFKDKVQLEIIKKMIEDKNSERPRFLEALKSYNKEKCRKQEIFFDKDKDNFNFKLKKEIKINGCDETDYIRNMFDPEHQGDDYTLSLAAEIYQKKIVVYEFYYFNQYYYFKQRKIFTKNGEKTLDNDIDEPEKNQIKDNEIAISRIDNIFPKNETYGSTTKKFNNLYDFVNSMT